MRMHLGNDPGTLTSFRHSNGVLFMLSSLAAAAGKTESRSRVTEKNMEAMSSIGMLLVSIIWFIRSFVSSRMLSLLLLLTVVAPLIPLTDIVFILSESAVLGKSLKKSSSGV